MGTEFVVWSRLISWLQLLDLPEERLNACALRSTGTDEFCPVTSEIVALTRNKKQFDEGIYKLTTINVWLKVLVKKQLTASAFNMIVILKIRSFSLKQSVN